MKNLKQIPQSWQPEVLMRQSPSKVSPRKRHLSGSQESDSRIKRSPGSRPLPASDTQSQKLDHSQVQEEKMEKLRDYFENVRLTPVKKIASGMYQHLVSLSRRRGEIYLPSGEWHGHSQKWFDSGLGNMFFSCN